MRIVEKRQNKLSSKSVDTRSAQHVEVLIDCMVTIMERLDHDSRVFKKKKRSLQTCLQASQSIFRPRRSSRIVQAPDNIPVLAAVVSKHIATASDVQFHSLNRSQTANYSTVCKYEWIKLCRKRI
jgi:hypothetical protein